MNRRTMVFEAIRTILDENGIDALTIANIAEKCHLHPNTVNYYFNGKMDMLMRFYTYLSDIDKAQISSIYYEVPGDTLEAVKAYVNIVDTELYVPLHAPSVRLKLHNHLLGMMSEQPQVRSYYAERHHASIMSFKQVFQRYADAGILEEANLPTGLSSLLMASSGHILLCYYYAVPPPEIDLAYERRRILKLMLRPEHHPLLERILSLSDSH